MELIGKRISYVKKEDELSIVISAYSEKRKNHLLLAWLIAWTLCGLIILVSLFKIPPGQTKTFMMVWLGFWVYFGYKIWKAYTWRRFGKEIIKIGKSQLFYKQDNRGAGKIRNFELASVQKLGKYTARKGEAINQFMSSYWVIAGESLSFDYFGKEILFGRELNEKDASALLKLMKEAM
jgi:hypothetical protein